MELVCGRHAVYHLISAGRRRVHQVHLQKGIDQSDPDLVRLIERKKLPLRWQEPAFFRSKFGAESNAQGVAAETDTYPYVPFEELLEYPFILVLDEIQDPHNLGALCRSAQLFGVQGVILAETHAASVSSGALQSSVGATEYLKIARVSSIAKALEIFKKNDFWIYGADHEAEKTIVEENFSRKVVLVIGGEEKGLRRLVRETCDILVRIPNVKGPIDSLNASVAGGIVIYEIFRQNISKNQ